MAQVHVDPEQLRDLVNSTTNQLEELKNTAQEMRQALERADNWQDEIRVKYEESLDALVTCINQHAEFAQEDLIPWLISRINYLEGYSEH